MCASLNWVFAGETSKEMRKGKRKQWWRPWVDHASSECSNITLNLYNSHFIQNKKSKQTTGAKGNNGRPNIQPIIGICVSKSERGTFF